MLKYVLVLYSEQQETCQYGDYKRPATYVTCHYHFKISLSLSLSLLYITSYKWRLMTSFPEISILIVISIWGCSNPITVYHN